MENTNIEWADHTFNAWWGCHKVSAACKHCYAETLASRFHPDLWGANGRRLLMNDNYWKQLPRWDKKAAALGVKHRVFVNSMSDICEDRPDLVTPRERLFDEIEKHNNLIFMLLTKRPENIMRLTSRWKHGFPDNVWVGTTAENQYYLDQRATILLDVPCKIKFLSCEPLLGNLEMWSYLPKVAWVIVGGESGTQARPMYSKWVKNILDQCITTGTPFFFKQWGSCIVDSSGKEIRADKKTHGRLFLGYEWNELPEE